LDIKPIDPAANHISLAPDISALSLKEILAFITQHLELKEFTPNNSCTPNIVDLYPPSTIAKEYNFLVHMNLKLFPTGTQPHLYGPVVV
jgi:hypothetical protein